MQIKGLDFCCRRKPPAISLSEMVKPGASLLILALGIMVAGCERSATPDFEPNTRHYNVRGIIRGVAPDASSVDVEHEDIPGFMPSMTMPFSARSPKDIAGLRAGDAIAFRMVVTDKDLFLDQVRKIPANEVHLPARTPPPTPIATASTRLKEGDDFPSFNLTNQKGERITNENFRGQPVVITFIFTRCAVPNFCPRMSGNFAELQKAVEEHQIPNARLLSISLDPTYDTPQILRDYGDHLGANPDVWTFATGDVEALLQAFSVYRQTEGGTISHGLATALVNGDGKIEKIWRGNAWAPAEVIETIRGENTNAVR